MAGFDLTSLLNQLMGKAQKQAQAAQQGQAGRPGRPGEPGQAPGGASSLLGSGMLSKLAPMISGLVAGGGLATLVEQLKGGGLGAQAKSWVSTDQRNQPITGQQLTQALGEDKISQFANTLDMSNEQAAHTMAAALPHVVDAMTPDGTLPQPTAATAPGAAGAPDAENSPASQAQNQPQAGGTSEGRPTGA
jgi:uncharacterized protein YidB (DUF937 family)